MNRSDVSVLPPTPNLVRSIRVGFDAIANHFLLIVFPLGLDLFLWLGPHLRITTLTRSVTDRLFRIYQNQDPALNETLRLSQEAWRLIADQFNLMAVLRSYPIGIPSLLVGRLPIANPLGTPQSLELFSPLQVTLVWLMLIVVGLLLGTLYFATVAQATLDGKIDWAQAISRWPWSTLQILCLAVIMVGILLVVSIPGSFLMALVLFGSLSFGQCALLLYAGFVFWLFIPLVFSPHGVFVYQYNVINSIKASINLARRTLPTTVLFILAAFLLSKGLDILWLVPTETSWLMLVGIIGHAFITTSLIAASFVYYRDADRWMRRAMEVQKAALG
jgi:hypothetical protein